MRRLAASALPLVLLVAFPAASAPAKPLPTGYNGLAWRSPVPAGMKLQKDVSTDDNAAYTRPGDSKKLYGAALESVTYGFFRGEFCSVVLQTDSGQGAKLLKALTAQWGPPEKAADNVFVWKDESETLAFYRTTDLEGSASRGELYIVCKPLVEEGNKVELERRKKMLGLK